MLNSKLAACNNSLLQVAV